MMLIVILILIPLSAILEMVTDILVIQTVTDLKDIAHLPMSIGLDHPNLVLEDPEHQY